MGLEEALTPEQMEILNTSGDLLVLAGPGCGKTTSMILKIKKLLEIEEKPEKIIVLSFSLKICTELKEKLTKEGLKDIRVDTFHGFAYDLWKDYYQKEPRILEEEEIKEILKKLFPREKNPLKDPQKKSLYQEYLNKQGLLDFEMLLNKASQLPFTFKNYHLFIDEFQDLSPEILDFLKQAKEATFYLFGDPNQSIYSFRGVNLHLIKQFLNHYKPTIKTVELTESFRCPEEILEVARDFQCSPWIIKNFKSRKQGGTIRGYFLPDEREEASFITEKVLQLIGGLTLERASTQALSPKDIFILSRIKRVHEPLINEFIQKGIPLALPEDKAQKLKEEVREFINKVLYKKYTFDRGLSEASLPLKLLLENWKNIHQDEQKIMTYLRGLTLSDLIFPQIEGVNFLTIHSAKGLEAEVVILIGVEHGLIPLKLFPNVDWEEEKRLLYVALTRTKKTFYFTGVQNRKLYHWTLSDGLTPWVSHLPIERITKKARTLRQSSLF
ncbi:MAG: ATP-dependent helicase [Caldimicrobium sp.]|nr:ATP-dependent helicase [Caldimicrobium sp.]MCX7873779.1 ATP-dependent helicase [Caldimicrobium sp.]MDW8095004.1 ATP-dependent helicase [Caldimicrobium sp.]